MLKMNLRRAQELIEPLKKGKANGISKAWQERLIEALEYVVENGQKKSDLVAAAECVLDWHDENLSDGVNREYSVKVLRDALQAYKDMVSLSGYNAPVDSI